MPLSLFCFGDSWSIVREEDRTIAIASDFRVDGAKLPEIPQKEGASVSEIATRNRKSLATFHRTLKRSAKSRESLADFWGPRWASQSQIAEIAAISVPYKDITQAMPHLKGLRG